MGAAGTTNGAVGGGRWRLVVPDGGWGWVVTAASFAIHVIADGFVYSFGIMVVELLNHFHEGRGITSWIVSILVGLTLGIGPISSAATNHFGCRATTIAGALVAATGCALSAFADSIFALFITVGVIMGVGFGLMYCPAIIIVTMYFERRRAFATGVAVCGAGIGTFLFSPLTTFLIVNYTWRGTFLIYSGIILNCAVCGALFRPLEFERIDDEATSLANMHGVERARVETAPADSPPSPQKRYLANGIAAETVPEADGAETQPLRAFSHASVRHSDAPRSLVRYTSVGDEAPTGRDGVVTRHARRRGVSESSGYLAIADVFYSGSIARLPDFESQGDIFRSIGSLPHLQSPPRHDDSAFDAPTTPREDETGAWADTKKVLMDMADMSILKNGVFVLFAVSNFLTSIGFNAPLIFLPDRAVMQFGISRRHSSLLLSAFGISNTIGRVVVGYFSDHALPMACGRDPARNRLFIYCTSITLCGLATFFSFLCRDFVSLLVYASFFGFSLSCYVCLTSVLLVDLLGLERLTNAFGVLLCFQGVASLVGPPIAGWIVDETGNYDNSFHFAGVGIAISGIMLFILPCVRRWCAHNTKC